MKRFLSLLMSCIAVLNILFSVPFITNAQTSEDNFSFTTRNSQVIITKYIGSDSVVEIPEMINGNPVTKIDRNAFYDNTKITDVIMPSGLKEIGSCAFQFCTGLKYVKFNEGLASIGKYCFYECTALKQLVLPSTLTDISSEALVCSSKLKYLFVPDSVSNIGAEGIGYCRNFIFENDDDSYTKKVSNFTVYASAGSYAEEYAEKNGFNFAETDSLFICSGKGASVRKSDSGLRFGFELDKESTLGFDEIYEAEYGFIYTFGNDTDNLSLENAGRNGVYKATAVKITKKEDLYSYNLVFTGIPQKNYNSVVSVVGYAVINGYVYYSNSVSASLSQIMQS